MYMTIPYTLSRRPGGRRACLTTCRSAASGEFDAHSPRSRAARRLQRLLRPPGEKRAPLARYCSPPRRRLRRTNRALAEPALELFM